MSLRKLLRKIKLKPVVRLRLQIQKFIYKVTGEMGVFLFCLLRSLGLMQTFQSYDAAKIKKILVVRPDRIGDLILSTPVFYNLRRHFPEANITLLIQEQNKDLIFNNSNINDLVLLKRSGFMNIFCNNLIGRLKIKKFDLAVVLYSSFWSCLLVFLAGIPQRLGYDFHGGGFLLTKKLKHKEGEAIKHEVEVNLDLIAAIGVKPEKKELEVSLDPKAEINVAKFLETLGILAQEQIAILHPGAYEEYIRWKASDFSAVADFLITEYKMKVIILGGPKEEMIVRKTASLMKNKAVMAMGLRLAEAISLIKRANIFVGNSTGPMHIAAALKIPVVAIFGSVHPLDCYQKWGPYGTKSIVVHKDIGCQTCQPAVCLDYRCMEAIRTEDVIAAIIKLL